MTREGVWGRGMPRGSPGLADDGKHAFSGIGVVSRALGPEERSEEGGGLGEGSAAGAGGVSGFTGSWVPKIDKKR